MKDPYSVLGVKSAASDGEIKSAYRKLAKTWHPDHHKDDPRAKDKFAEINNAYEIIGDKGKRAQFDRGEIGADGKPKVTGFDPRQGGFSAGGDFSGFSRGFSPRGGGFAGAGGGGATDDILRSIFGEAFGAAGRGNASQRAGQPPRYDDFAAGDTVTSLKVRLEEIAAGGKVRVSLPGGRALDVALPAGVEHGQQIRLKGQGSGGGDAIVTVQIEPHPLFRPDGPHLRLDLPVRLDEAVLGAKVRVPTLEGAVEMKLPANTTGGKAMRLKGRGLPDRAGGRGDLIVTPRIVLPDDVDGGLEQLMKHWAETKKNYGPRGPEFG